jgi:23S rRNA (cytosine1962-C5)-methyltransferase
MKRREAAIMDALGQLLAPSTIYEVSPGAFAEIEGVPNMPRVARGVSRPVVPYRERGFALEVEPLVGQKTGAFLDQRDNRTAVERLAKGRRVLDLYCYTGGFALAAARGGAQRVTAVESSSKALGRARGHLEANKLAAELVEADVMKFLETAAPGSYDLIVCDPPKFATARKDLEAALRGYRRLNAACLAALAPGGLLVTCSCSGLVDAVEFERMLAGAAENAHRRLQVLELRGAAPDHVIPVAFAEGRYLKVIIARAP